MGDLVLAVEVDEVDIDVEGAVDVGFAVGGRSAAELLHVSFLEVEEFGGSAGTDMPQILKTTAENGLLVVAAGDEPSHQCALDRGHYRLVGGKLS